MKIRFFNILTHIAGLLFILSLFVGCTKEETIINISASSIQMVSTNESFTVSSNSAWILSQSGNYSFSISPTSGIPGETVVNVTYSPNTTAEPRSSVVTISAGDVSKSLQITQNPVEFSVAPDGLVLPAEASSQKIAIKSNTDWNITDITVPTWIKSITPTSGSGNGELTVSTNENTSRLSENSYILKIKYAGSLSKQVEIKQEAAFNNPPTKPEIIFPANGATEITLMPIFEWNGSEDAEGDKINYFVYISEDNNSWKNISAGENTSVPLPASIGVLKPNTKYYYKVAANDGNNKGVTESDVFTFTTSAKDAYSDGEYMVYMESTKPNPAYLFFTGDGYKAESFKYGGDFDKDVNEAIEAFFEIEPYKSYKEYFTVYKIAAYSNQTGVTNLAENSYRDTKFKVQWDGKTTSLNMTDSGDKVFDFCKTIPGISDTQLKNGAVGIVVNADIYAGTCITFSNGKSVSMIPYLRNSSNKTTTFKNVVQHEMGGHGFGRLADEYQNSTEKITDEEKESLLSWQQSGYFRNVSVVAQMDKSPWANFKGLSGYSHVGMYEGGYYYKQGVWRPEVISCMEDNRSYYNSPSRYFIVERIMNIAGETFTLDKFIQKDVVKTDTTEATENGTKSLVWDEFVPLGKPILIK